MFDVEFEGKIHTVYSVKLIENITRFLIYDNNDWYWVLAGETKPIRYHH